MTGHKPPKGPPTTWLPDGWNKPDRPPPPKRCCARCRRGVPGFGDLPCGYLGDCKCHAKKTEQ